MTLGETVRRATLKRKTDVGRLELPPVLVARKPLRGVTILPVIERVWPHFYRFSLGLFRLYSSPLLHAVYVALSSSLSSPSSPPLVAFSNYRIVSSRGSLTLTASLLSNFVNVQSNLNGELNATFSSTVKLSIVTVTLGMRARIHQVSCTLGFSHCPVFR